MKLKFILFYIFLSGNVFCQGIDNLWLMGYESKLPGRLYPFGGTNLTFTATTMDTIYQSRKMNFSATNGVICDKSGNLLFSSNGLFIANAYDDTMLNGGGLNPSVYDSIIISEEIGLDIPQANLIIPFPGDSTKYYLFHETDDDYYNTGASFYFYYSVIDMTQDSGKGMVIQKNVVLISDSFVGGFLTACKHANGRDWWLVNHQWGSNTYFMYLISLDGINGPYTQNIGSNRRDFFGQMVFSPNGNKAAYYDPNTYLDIMDFDRCTGNFGNLIHIDINDSAIGGGVAFSPNSKVLYVSSDGYVYQFDLTSSNIPSTQTTVAVYDGFYYPSYGSFTTFGLSQVAPDGKIYIACLNSTQAIHVINYPDSLGLGCDVCQHCVYLPSINYLTVANHLNYFLGAETGSVCDSLTSLTPTLSKGEGVFEMFPNPVVERDEVTFTYNVSSERSIISIYNTLGKEVAHYCLPQWSSVQHLKLPELASGVYLAQLTQGNTVADVKFSKE